VEVADFSPEQVEQFAQNWFRALSETPEQGAEQATDFISKLKQPEHQQTAELAITPVLLSLACWVFQDQGDFPQERSDLYRRGVELLLNTWDGDRGIQREFKSPIYQNLSIEDKQNLLGAIAIQKFQQDQFALFTQQEIQKYIADHLKIDKADCQAVLKSIEAQHGLLVERASEIYSFSHLTFQEYFAARWLCDAGNWQSVESDVTQKRWKDVLSIAFTLPNADRLAQAVKAEVDQMLVADPKLQQFLAWLSEKERLVEASYRRVTLRVFYFAIDRDRALDLDLDRVRTLAFDRDRALVFALDLDLDLDRDRALDRVLDLDLALALALDLDFTRALARDLDLDRTLDRTIDLDLDRTIALDLDLARARTLARAFDLARTLARALDLTLALDRALDRARANANDSELQRKLKVLLNQLPTRSNCYQWWQTSGEAWKQQLRWLMIEHRNIGHDWQFTEAQKQKLQQYYDANKLLVDCLKQKQCKVSPEVRQAIEDSLLLPVRSEG
jgi:predicted NACHT family NTPase